MSEIKSAEERIHPMALDDKSVWCNAYFDEVAELRAAYEALQKENAAQAKRIEELEAATDHLGLTPKQAADGLTRHKAQVAEIESLRKQVEILQRPLDDEIISRIVCLVKNIPDEELASNVFEMDIQNLKCRMF